MINLKELTIKKAHKHLKKGDFSAVELAQAYMDEIGKKNKDINAYLELFADVREQASEADKRIAEYKKSGQPIPILCGTPFAIKDNILIKGRIASAASKILENYHATYDATVVEKLKKEGAVFLGRTNMDEFAMGGSTENSAFGVTKNPHDTTRVAGGTSGGSAAAVASNMALVALGSDTGGSVRQPSAFCGVIGLKPTYGAVSRYGLMATVSSLDQVGPIARTIGDAETIFDAIKGTDARDGTSFKADTYKPQRAGKKKPLIGVPYDFLSQGGIHKDILKNFDESVKSLERAGYEIKKIALPNIKYCLPVYYIINFAEASSNLARYDGVRYGLHVDGKDGIDDYFETRGAGFGKEVRRRILLGTYLLSSGYYDAYYNRANALRRVITNDFIKAFDPLAGGVDIIVTPTTPAPAFKIGEKTADPVAMYLEDIFTVTANLTGMPAISIPSGFSETADGGEGKKLPLGLQMTARHGDEKTLFQVGREFLGE